MRSKTIQSKQFNPEDFADFLIEKGCIGFYEEPITLSSGSESNWYVNLRELLKKQSSLRKYTNYVVEFLRSKNLERQILVGVPEAATLPAIKANERLGRDDILYLRSSAKSHGISGKFPYSLAPVDITGWEINLFEDTLTTADSAIKTGLDIIAGGGFVKNMVVVCYREDKRWGGMYPHEYVQKYLRTKVHTMVTASQILPKAIEYFKPNQEIIDSLRREYLEHPKLSKLLLTI